MAAKSSPAAAEPGICFICTRAHKYTIRPDQDTRYIDCISYADICVLDLRALLVAKLLT